MRGEISFPKSRSRRTTNQHNSPIVIPNWRYFGNKGLQQRAQIGGETTPFKQTSQRTRIIQLQQHESPPARRLRLANIGKGRVAAREEAAIGKHRQGTASTDENKQYDPGGTGGDPLIST